MSDKRFNNISCLRVIAIIMVVFGHSIIIYSSSWALYETTNNVACLNLIKKLIDAIQMPLFFSISGFLYYASSKRNIQSISETIKKKSKRLLLPFIFIGVLWMIPIRFL